MTGWHCPGCDRCYAPSVVMCLYCGPEDKMFTMGTTKVSDECPVCGKSRLEDPSSDCPTNEHYGISWPATGGAA